MYDREEDPPAFSSTDQQDVEGYFAPQNTGLSMSSETYPSLYAERSSGYHTNAYPAPWFPAHTDPSYNPQSISPTVYDVCAQETYTQVQETASVGSQQQYPGAGYTPFPTTSQLASSRSQLSPLNLWNGTPLPVAPTTAGSSDQLHPIHYDQSYTHNKGATERSGAATIPRSSSFGLPAAFETVHEAELNEFLAGGGGWEQAPSTESLGYGSMPTSACPQWSMEAQASSQCATSQHLGRINNVNGEQSMGATFHSTTSNVNAVDAQGPHNVSPSSQGHNDNFVVADHGHGSGLFEHWGLSSDDDSDDSPTSLDHELFWRISGYDRAEFLGEAARGNSDAAPPQDLVGQQESIMASDVNGMPSLDEGYGSYIQMGDDTGMGSGSFCTRTEPNGFVGHQYSAAVSSEYSGSGQLQTVSAPAENSCQIEGGTAQASSSVETSIETVGLVPTSMPLFQSTEYSGEGHLEQYRQIHPGHSAPVTPLHHERHPPANYSPTSHFQPHEQSNLPVVPPNTENLRGRRRLINIGISKSVREILHEAQAGLQGRTTQLEIHCHRPLKPEEERYLCQWIQRTVRKMTSLQALSLRCYDHKYIPPGPKHIILWSPLHLYFHPSAPLTSLSTVNLDKAGTSIAELLAMLRALPNIVDFRAQMTQDDPLRSEVLSRATRCKLSSTSGSVNSGEVPSHASNSTAGKLRVPELQSLFLYNFSWSIAATSYILSLIEDTSSINTLSIPSGARWDLTLMKYILAYQLPASCRIQKFCCEVEPASRVPHQAQELAELLADEKVNHSLSQLVLSGDPSQTLSCVYRILLFPERFEQGNMNSPSFPLPKLRDLVVPEQAFKRVDEQLDVIRKSGSPRWMNLYSTSLSRSSPVFVTDMRETCLEVSMV